MSKELTRFLMFMRPAFSRQATHVWFVIVFVGFLVRNDTLGVSSIIRGLSLAPESYNCLLHFFHSTGWSVDRLTALWWDWLSQQDVAYHLHDRLVLTGDDAKTPKDGRSSHTASGFGDGTGQDHQGQFIRFRKRLDNAVNSR